MITALHLQILLHYHRVPPGIDYPFHGIAENQDAALELFHAAMLESPIDAFEGPDENALYEITARGRAYVEAVLLTPMPQSRMVWIVPAQPERHL